MELTYTHKKIIQIEEIGGIGISKISQFIDAKDAEDYLRTKRMEFKNKKEWINYLNENMIFSEIKILKVK